MPKWRASIAAADQKELPLWLIDRDVATTFRRVAHRVSFWQKLNIFSGLVFSVFSSEDISEDEIERLKEGDILESTFNEFALNSADLYEALISERDQYMAARLTQEARVLHRESKPKVLVVIGAGHLKGMCEHLRGDPVDVDQHVEALEQQPPKRGWLKAIPWVIVIVILAMFAKGFSESPELGWALVRDWVLINGGLSALGCIAALAHPITILTAFVAAPLTSLNPTIGAGMVCGAVEVWLRRPQVGDFTQLRHDITETSGWWKNRVSRALLVFLFATLGSAIGTWVAGAAIFEKLT